MVRKLVLMEEGGALKIMTVEMTIDLTNSWVNEFVVDQSNLGDMHAAFRSHVYVTKQKNQKY